MAERTRPQPPFDPPRQTGRLIELDSYRKRFAELNHDATINAAWDGLLTAVMAAWTWRDPDSLDAIEAQVGRLRAAVDQDWGSAGPKRLVPVAVDVHDLADGTTRGRSVAAARPAERDDRARLHPPR
jgi:hypothetical protein